MQAPTGLGQIIATRPLAWVDQNGNNNTALVQIGLPFADPNGTGLWACGFTVTGLGNDIAQTTYGSDSVDALSQALYSCAFFVSTSPPAIGLDWAVLPNWGFPVTPTPQNSSFPGLANLGGGQNGGGQNPGCGGGGVNPMGGDGAESIILEPIPPKK